MTSVKAQMGHTPLAHLPMSLLKTRRGDWLFARLYSPQLRHHAGSTEAFGSGEAARCAHA